MNSSTPSNVIDFVSRETLDETEATAGHSASAEDLQLWSALTLGSLQKQLTGHENDPRFEAARNLVDQIARQFASSNPVEIADYFEAVEAISALKSESRSRLDELDAYDPLAA